MKERLINLLRDKGLSAVRFAEIMGVQASSISHLLSGRNKPNFDFIAKLLERFPEVSPDWFILGKGDMYRTNDAPRDLFEKQEMTTIKESSDVAFRETEKEPEIPAVVSSLKSIRQLIALHEDGTFSVYSNTSQST